MANERKKLIRLLRDRRWTLSELSDELGVTEEQAEALVTQLMDSNVAVYGDMRGREKKIRFHIDTDPDNGNVWDFGTEKGAGNMRFAASSDWHFASTFHLRRTWYDAMSATRDAGIDRVFMAGDVIDGTNIYKGHQENIIHPSVERQTDLVARALEDFPDLEFLAIAGNHDYSFTQRAGVKPLAILEAKTSNFRNLGDLRADVIVDGIKIRLLHGAGGRAYATSYPSQTYLRDYFKGLDREDMASLPHLMIIGHYHTLYQGHDHGIWILQPGSFQDGDNEYCVRRGLTGPHGHWHVDLDHEDGQVTRFRTEYVQPLSRQKEKGRAFKKTSVSYRRGASEL